MTNRYCFTFRVRTDSLVAYRQHHETVWPEMLTALRDAGWSNYSLFTRPDGLVVGYVETDDFTAAQQTMAGTEVNDRWQAVMATFAGAGQRPDTDLVVLDHMFSLDDQPGPASTDPTHREDTK